jgi:hypothetical protein
LVTAEEERRRRFFAVLHTNNKINSPVAAVRGPIVAEHRVTRGGDQ